MDIVKRDETKPEVRVASGELSWQFFLDTRSAWQAMLDDCEQALVSIDLEQFIFIPDQVGLKFAELLIKKAKQGVKVRVVMDAAGSFRFFTSPYLAAFSKQGVEVKFYNPIDPWRIRNFSLWAFRDHRKLLIIDSRIVHLGGVGIEAAAADWRDTNVRLMGTIVSEVKAEFERMWLRIIEGGFRHSLRHPKADGSPFIFLINSPRFKKRFFYHELLTAIKRAKKYIYLTSPYFVPTQRLFFLLLRAARKKVDVRILIPDASDHPIVDAAARSFFTLALKSGIRLFRYPKKMLHVKTGVIDDIWAYIGSSNLDNMSTVFNHEADLVSREVAMCAELKRHFFDDLTVSIEISQEDWFRRPTYQKVMEYLTWPLHGLL